MLAPTTGVDMFAPVRMSVGLGLRASVGSRTALGRAGEAQTNRPAELAPIPGPSWHLRAGGSQVGTSTDGSWSS